MAAELNNSIRFFDASVYMQPNHSHNCYWRGGCAIDCNKLAPLALSKDRSGIITIPRTQVVQTTGLAQVLRHRVTIGMNVQGQVHFRVQTGSCIVIAQKLLSMRAVYVLSTFISVENDSEQLNFVGLSFGSRWDDGNVNHQTFRAVVLLQLDWIIQKL